MIETNTFNSVWDALMNITAALGQRVYTPSCFVARMRWNEL